MAVLEAGMMWMDPSLAAEGERNEVGELRRSRAHDLHA